MKCYQTSNYKAFQQIFDYLESTKKDAEWGFKSESGDFSNEFGTERCKDIWYESPEIEPIRLTLDLMPAMDEGEEMKDYKSVMAYLKNICETEITLKELTLVLSFQYVADYGSEIEKKPFQCLIINAEWIA